MTLNPGQPGENPEATVEPQLEAGTEALDPTPEAPPEPEPTVRFQWGRDTKEIPQSVVNSTAEAFGTSPEAVRTWIQMGRDAASVYSTTRQQAAEAARRQAELDSREKALNERLAQLEARTAASSKRPDITQDPVGFWTDVAQKIDKLDKLDRFDQMERMLAETRERLDASRKAQDDQELDQMFMSEHQRLMQEKARQGLPQIDLQTIASTLDRFVTEIPEGTTIPELLEMGYRIVTWDTIGNKRVQQEVNRMRQPHARVTVPASAGPAEPNGAIQAGETLEQRRARLHRQVGGMTIGQWHAEADGR